MADSDWRLYRQIRGKPLPLYIDIGSAQYVQQQLLKQDFYAAVGLYQLEKEVVGEDHPLHVLLKIYHTDPFWGIPLGWLGRWLCRRESRCYERLIGVVGVPRWMGTYGEAGFLREYLQGCNLREYRFRQVPGVDFYPELLKILNQVHAVGLSHNDLSKPENILVQDSGRPGLIDFQIALGPYSTWNWPMRRFLRYMQQVDRYHVMKHYTHDHKSKFSPEEISRVRRKGWLLWLHGMFLRRPYRAVRHTLVLPFLREKPSQKAA